MKNSILAAVVAVAATIATLVTASHLSTYSGRIFGSPDQTPGPGCVRVEVPSGAWAC
jgi:hypothetical protein